jgi:hypothetical protein
MYAAPVSHLSIHDIGWMMDPPELDDARKYRMKVRKEVVGLAVAVRVTTRTKQSGRKSSQVNATLMYREYSSDGTMS